MEIILYNLQGEKRDRYIKKLKLIEPTADFLTETKGNPERAVIEIKSHIDRRGHIRDDEFCKIDTLLKNVGFYIFPHDNTFKQEKNSTVIKTLEISLEKSLLMIGNGFDIAHGLNTKYTHFLEQLIALNNVFLNLVNTDIQTNKLYEDLFYNFSNKEILSRIINDTHVKKIVIFYHNEAHYRQEISNLVKILDKNIFLKYVAEHRIEFKEQSS